MIYIFDIDGTICHTNGSDYKNSVPKHDRINRINKLYDEGNTIILLTARGMGRSGNGVMFSYKKFYEFTKKQLESWGVQFHDLFLGKPSGDYYIDDKGIEADAFFADDSR